MCHVIPSEQIDFLHDELSLTWFRTRNILHWWWLWWSPAADHLIMVLFSLPIQGSSPIRGLIYSQSTHDPETKSKRRSPGYSMACSFPYGLSVQTQLFLLPSQSSPDHLSCWGRDQENTLKGCQKGGNEIAWNPSGAPTTTPFSQWDGRRESDSPGRIWVTVGREEMSSPLKPHPKYFPEGRCLSRAKMPLLLWF